MSEYRDYAEEERERAREVARRTERTEALMAQLKIHRELAEYLADQERLNQRRYTGF